MRTTIISVLVSLLSLFSNISAQEFDSPSYVPYDVLDSLNSSRGESWFDNLPPKSTSDSVNQTVNMTTTSRQEAAVSQYEDSLYAAGATTGWLEKKQTVSHKDASGTTPRLSEQELIDLVNGSIYMQNGVNPPAITATPKTSIPPSLASEE